MEVDSTESTACLDSTAHYANLVNNPDQVSSLSCTMSTNIVDRETQPTSLNAEENSKINFISDEDRSQNKTDATEEAVDSCSGTKQGILEVNEEVPQNCVKAIKRRRRSTFLLQHVEGGTPPPADDVSSKSSPRAADDGSCDSLEARKSRAASRRRSTGNRRSMCAVLPPLLTVAEQVSRVSAAESSPSSRVLCQLLDISIRDPLSKLCHQHSSNEQFAALKGVVMLNSEQLADDTSREISEQKVVLPQLAARPKADAATKENSGGKDPVATAGSKTLHQESSTNASAQYKQWLLSEYGARTKRLLAEYREWKQLRRSRIEADNVAKREWAESRSGGGNRIGEEQHALISPAQRAFLAAAPDYRSLLRGLATAVEQSSASAADYEKAVCGLQATRLAAQAAADRAYYLTEAAVYSGNRSTLRCHLHELQQTCADVDDECITGTSRPLQAVEPAH